MNLRCIQNWPQGGAGAGHRQRIAAVTLVVYRQGGKGDRCSSVVIRDGAMVLSALAISAVSPSPGTVLGVQFPAVAQLPLPAFQVSVAAWAVAPLNACCRRDDYQRRSPRYRRPPMILDSLCRMKHPSSGTMRQAENPPADPWACYDTETGFAERRMYPWLPRIQEQKSIEAVGGAPHPADIFEMADTRQIRQMPVVFRNGRQISGLPKLPFSYPKHFPSPARTPPPGESIRLTPALRR